MNAMNQSALNAYSRVGVETAISIANPHRLIAMLYEGALIAIAIGKGHMQRHEISLKGAAISKAISIIDEGLKISLDEKVGGELAVNLKALYEYMSQRLLESNLKNDEAGLDEVSGLLLELKSAWDEIGKQPQALNPAPAPQAAPQRASLSYGKA